LEVSDHDSFPDCYTVLRSDRSSANKKRGGGVFIALSSRVRSCKGRYDLESCDECVWLEIPTFNCLNLLIGNHFFPPNTKPEIIVNRLDTYNFRVNKFGDFNSPGLSWPNSHYYSKLREMGPTPPRVFLTLARALILSAAAIYLI
jgi:hypothetical protein